jgi:tetratricopeptide (TPR) repeat protein
MQIAHSLATQGPPDLREAWTRAPAAAAQVLKRGMALEPDDRQASAGELARELTEALRDEPRTAPTRRFTPRSPVIPPPPPPPTRGDSTAGAKPPSTAAPVRSRQRGRRPGGLIALALVFIALAIAAAAGAVLSGGDDKGSSPAADSTPRTPAKKGNAKKKQEPKKEPKAEQPAAPSPTPAPAPAQEEQQQPAADGTSGADLNAQGFDLMNQGRYDEAIPILQRAVDSFPSGTTDLNYAYALFNLGKSLRLAGRPDDAIPILEQRLKIPNQTETVRQELELAKQQAKGK